MARRPETRPDRERRWLERVPVGPFSALEFSLLGLLALALVLYAIPRAFGLESDCVAGAGVVTVPGDTYIGAYAVLGTLGWLAVFLGMLYASIAEREDIMLLLPALWFVVLVLSALVAAAAVGPSPCPT
ncbi:MAG TPA: hypothetical protein VNJ53_09395 [Gaiellaceae bacterium]|nr:hypothetical protein [Gaiellaceae bacterium]